MKVLLLNGSANKNGNTFTALSEIDKQLEKNGLESEACGRNARYRPGQNLLLNVSLYDLHHGLLIFLLWQASLWVERPDSLDHTLCGRLT